jgi:hypothetical protein
MRDVNASLPASGQAGLPPVIVTVHGTNDARVDDDGPQWWQRGSSFSQRLRDELIARGIADPEIRPFHWSGSNSDFDRMAGSLRLAKLLRTLARQGRRHAVLAHSHGGNVTVEALAVTPPASATRGGIVSFGTPFFARRLKAVPRVIAMFQIALGLSMLPIMLWFLFTALSSDTNKKIEAAVFFGGLAFVAGWSLIAGLRKLAHRHLATLRLAGTIGPEQWLVIHSPRDEAMRLLESAAMIRPSYVSTASARRTLTAFASLAGVIATVGLFAWFGRNFLDPIAGKLAAGEFGLGVAADLTFLMLIPVVYGVVYFAIWALARLGGAWLYARSLSSAIHGGVLGAAFGGDGRHRLTGVTRVPPYLAGAKEERIDAISLGGVDDAAVFVAAQKLYDSVVTHDHVEGGIGDPDVLWKRLSDALYHNAYMRDDAVIATVAEHLASSWGAAR